MRYPASEKLEIIRLVEGSSLPVRRTLERIGIPRATFYRWYDLYCSTGPEALEDHRPRPDRVWNRIPEDVRDRIVKLALDEPTLSPRELAVRFACHWFPYGMPIGRLRVHPPLAKATGIECGLVEGPATGPRRLRIRDGRFWLPP